MKSLVSPCNIDRQRRTHCCAEVYLSGLIEAASAIIFPRKISLPKRIPQPAVHFTRDATKSVLPATIRHLLSFHPGEIGDPYYALHPIESSRVIEVQELCQTK